MNKKVLIIIAQRERTHHHDDQRLLTWALQQGFPVLLDCQSQQASTANSIHYYDQLLHRADFSQCLAETECIIQLGGHLISKRLQQFIGTQVAEKQTPYWLLSETKQWNSARVKLFCWVPTYLTIL